MSHWNVFGDDVVEEISRQKVRKNNFFCSDFGLSFTETLLKSRLYARLNQTMYWKRFSSTKMAAHCLFRSVSDILSGRIFVCSKPCRNRCHLLCLIFRSSWLDHMKFDENFCCALKNFLDAFETHFLAFNLLFCGFACALAHVVLAWLIWWTKRIVTKTTVKMKLLSLEKHSLHRINFIYDEKK